jgi:O-antigen/teichoic acid export membrane protein
VVSSYASYLLNFFNLRKYITFCPLRELNFSRHIKMVLSFFAMSCATTIYTNLDTVMLEFMSGDIEVGYYSAAIKVKTVLVAVVTSLGTVLLPRASYYVENDLLNEFKSISQKALRFVILVAPPLMIYFTIFAEETIYLLSGTYFSGSIIPMQVIMPTLLAIGLTNIMGIQMLIPMGKEKIVLWSEIAGAIVDFVINFALIPRFASTGAAIGTLSAEIVVWIVQFFSLKKIVGTMYRHLPYMSVVAGCIVGGMASVWIKKLNTGLFITLLLSAILFFFAYWLVLHIARESLVRELEMKMTQKIRGIVKKRQ